MHPSRPLGTEPSGSRKGVCGGRGRGGRGRRGLAGQPHTLLAARVAIASSPLGPARAPLRPEVGPLSWSHPTSLLQVPEVAQVSCQEGLPLSNFSPAQGPHCGLLLPYLPQTRDTVNAGLTPSCSQQRRWGWGAGAGLSGNMDFCSGFTGKAVAEGGRGHHGNFWLWEQVGWWEPILPGAQGDPVGQRRPEGCTAVLQRSSSSWGGGEALPNRCYPLLCRPPEPLPRTEFLAQPDPGLCTPTPQLWNG